MVRQKSSAFEQLLPLMPTWKALKFLGRLKIISMSLTLTFVRSTAKTVTERKRGLIRKRVEVGEMKI